MLHYALLDASLGTPHAKRNFERETDATLSVFDVNEGELPPPVADPRASGDAGMPSPFDAVIISGSQSSVYHDEPWIAELTTWVRGAIEAELPILGVCWGHQLLAQIMGGTVEHRGEYELGYVEVEQVVRDPLFDGIPNPFTVFATHADEVMDVPDDVTVIARNEAGIQAFRKNRIYGVQFHPEYDMRTAEDMIRRKDISMRAMQDALQSVTQDNVKAAQQPKKIFANFLDFVQELKEERLEAAK